ncbi:MAG TPA: WecB/TagA/CpsF family glycosyltransferase, partial [Candidatus Cloacimonadota bacterium]|nr:WecB/TagA/CpsF family glycosyltransferase [Candidatus Cloacimonadota bacterium]
KLDRPFCCTIVGRGNDETYLKELARRMGISDKIMFRGFSTDISEYYRQADMAIVPFRWQEPFGLVGLEAFAYQIPVVGFAVGGITEWLKHQVNGLAVREGDTSRLAGAIRKLMDDPDARKLYATAGYALLQKRFTRAAFKESFIPHLENLINQKPSREDQMEEGPEIFGIKLANLSMSEAMTRVETAIITAKQKEVFFVNADCLNKVFVDKDYHAILKGSKDLFPDGIGIKLAGKILGKPVRENINGTDMLPLLCEMAAKHGYSMYLLGAAEGVAETMKTKLVQKYPRLNICGFRSGYFDHDNDSDVVIKEINDSRPDILLVAFGAPLQEKFIHKHAAEIEACVLMGVGGLFDFYSGRIARAPYWMRQIGMEWVFRLMKEPKRMWKRYIIGNPVFIYRVFRWKMNRDYGGF